MLQPNSSVQLSCGLVTVSYPTFWPSQMTRRSSSHPTCPSAPSAGCIMHSVQRAHQTRHMSEQEQVLFSITLTHARLTMPAMEGSLWPYSKQVTAPMLLPHNATALSGYLVLKCLTQTSRSSTSCAPSVTHSPSERPEPCQKYRRLFRLCEGRLEKCPQSE